MPTVMLPPDVSTQLVMRTHCPESLQRLRIKEQVVEQLIAGQLSLTEAASRFRATLANPGNGEQVCRMVIGWVGLALVNRPEQADSLTERLESELKRILERGRACLPTR